MSEMLRPDGSPIRVLVVDDEEALAALLSSALKYEGWEIHTAGSGMSALRLSREVDPDVILLDVMLPDLDGFEVLRRLRREGRTVPVLFLTARDAVEDRVTGLMAGGDDYVVKPYSLEEVVARITALVRRAGIAELAAPEATVLTVGDLELNEDSHEVRRGGEEIQLSATEYGLLHFLMVNERKVLSKAQILDRVWGYDFGGRSTVVELYISYLRRKIDQGRPPMIHTLRGAGYILKPGESS